jgi:hypothetical protein
VFDPIVDRFKEIRSEDAARNAAAAEGDLGAFLDVGSENDPAFLSSAMDGFSPMAEVSTLSGDNFNNDPATGYSYPTDLPPLDPRMEGREVAGRVMDALTEGEGSSLPEDIYGGYENPEAIARRQEIERMISLEPLGEGRQSDVETILEDRIAEDIEATTTTPVATKDTTRDTTTDTSTSVGSSGRIAKMLEDRQKSAESDKWMALAQTGLALMASDQPTLGGAIGEAGLAGIGALQQSRQGMQDFEMDMLKLQTQIDAANRKSGSKGGLTAGNIISYVDDLARQQSDVQDKLDELDTGTFMGTEEQKEAIRKRLQTNLFQVNLELSTYRNALRGGQPSSGSAFDVTGGSQSTGN